MPKVLNKHAMRSYQPGAVYIGRGSRFGNPFKIGEPGPDGRPMSRDAVCERFEKEVLPNLDVRELRGKDLVCFCAPYRCHGDAILRKANADK